MTREDRIEALKRALHQTEFLGYETTAAQAEIKGIVAQNQLCDKVTEVGHEFYLHCKTMLEEAAAAMQAVELSRSEPRGLIRLTCPVALLHARVGAMIAALIRWSIGNRLM